jgi:two-component system cell cycle sensor histidine kinase/response regulator CckA
MSQERFGGLSLELLDAIPSGVAVYEVHNDGLSGADYTVVDFNRAALAHEGKSRDEVVGKSLIELRPRIEEFGLIPVLRRVWKTGEPAFLSARSYVDDSFSCWYENRISRLGPKHVVAVYNDVTPYKNSEEELRTSESLLRDVLESFDKAIAIYEPVDGGKDYVFLGMNKAGEPVTHRKVEEVLGKRIRELFPGESSVGLIESLNTARQSGEIVRIPLKEYRDERITQWVENTIYPLPSGRVVAIFEDTFEQRMAERARQEDEARYRLAQHIGKSGAWEYNLQTQCFWGSDEAKRLYGFDPDDENFTTDEVENCIPDRERVHQALIALIEEDAPYDIEFEIIPRDGSARRSISSIARLLRDERGEPLKVVGVVQDVTERRRQEQQLLELERRYERSKKLETVGRLAGGIAHDFNNLLTIINGHAELALQDMRGGDPLRDSIEQVLEAGERAATLTRQLLAFSRKQVLEPKVLDLNAIIHSLQRMLRSVLGEDILLEIAPARELGRIGADPSQLEQVLMNLVVNARDAMPQGGQLRIETANLPPEAIEQSDALRALSLQPGIPYVRLTVTDHGVGMDEETKQRIFEPFFTTKEQGRGTGLGLATIYGIVKQSHGEIEVETEEGRGTSFHIYFPQVEHAVHSIGSWDDRRAGAKGTETLLVVEDEPAVRDLTQRVLEDAGYSVIAAESGDVALEHWKTKEGSIDLLLTDVVMPRMGGRELVNRLRALGHNTKTLFISGYTDDAIAQHGVLEEGLHLLSKPFSAQALLSKVRSVLDSESSRTPG